MRHFESPPFISDYTPAILEIQLIRCIIHKVNYDNKLQKRITVQN